MTYLLQDADPAYKSWRDYFGNKFDDLQICLPVSLNALRTSTPDVIIVNAQKPRFFAGGTTLRMVDLRTGMLKVSKTTSFEPGQVYSGGSLEIFNKFTRMATNHGFQHSLKDL